MGDTPPPQDPTGPHCPAGSHRDPRVRRDVSRLHQGRVCTGTRLHGDRSRLHQGRACTGMGRVCTRVVFAQGRGSFAPGGPLHQHRLCTGMGCVCTRLPVAPGTRSHAAVFAQGRGAFTRAFVLAGGVAGGRAVFAGGWDPFAPRLRLHKDGFAAGPLSRRVPPVSPLPCPGRCSALPVPGAVRGAAPRAPPPARRGRPSGGWGGRWVAVGGRDELGGRPQ